MSPLRSAVPRRWPVAVVAGVTCLVLAGCGSWFSGDDNDGENAGKEVAAGLEDELTDRPDVVSASVVYQDNITATQQASADVVVTPGTDPQTVSDEVVELLWTSDLDGLQVMVVSVGVQDDPSSLVEQRIRLNDPAQRAAVEEQYGPRPD